MSTSKAGGRRGPAPAAERLGKQARNVGDNIREMGNTVADAAQEQFDKARDTATAYYEEGRDRMMEVEGSFEEYIRDQPLKSILIAAGVGYLLGKFL
jgi:ElaB/YqjD/DUF883 family membrane-anchored ribosome-binding protein